MTKTTKYPFITFEQFKEKILAIKEYSILQDKIYDAVYKYNNNTKDSADLLLPSLMWCVTDLLSLATGDESGWIAYWVYELDFGRRYEDGTIQDSDGKNIKLKTVEDLWALIQSNKVIIEIDY